MNYRICTKCNKEFEATTEFFHKQKDGKYSLTPTCKKCNNKHSKRDYEKNKEKYNLRITDYQKKNKNKVVYNYKPKYKALIEKKFNMLVVVKYLYTKSSRAYFECLCGCGNTITIAMGSLGRTKSCGCLHRLKGEDHHNWDPNITDEEREIGRFYPEYKAWRKDVYERDNYTCQICGQRGGHELNSHHLEGYAGNKDLRTTLSNGITLCKDCHDNFHHQYGGNGNNTKEQFKEFKNDYNNRRVTNTS